MGCDYLIVSAGFFMSMLKGEIADILNSELTAVK